MKVRGMQPSEGVWLIINLLILAMIVAVPAAAWAAMEAITYGRIAPF